MQSVKMFVWNTFENDARVLRECQALSDYGYQVTLICLRQHLPKSSKKICYNKKFSVYRLSDINFKYLSLFIGFVGIISYFSSFIALSLISLLLLTLLSIKKVRSFLNKTYLILAMGLFGAWKKYDFYHANDLNTLPQAFFQSKLIRNKILIYDSHEVQVSRTGYDSTLYAKSEKFFMSRVDKCIHENNTRAEFTEILYEREINVLHNYPVSFDRREVEIGALHKALNISQEVPIYLYQGGLQSGRGLENIIQAMQYINIGVAVFIGDGKLKSELKKLVRELQITDKIFFIDKVPIERLSLYTIDAFLGFQVLKNTCFNHYSAASNKLFEYIMAEVPVIGSNFPEIKKVLSTSKAGILIDPDCVEEIVDAINWLLEDTSLYQTCKTGCREAKQIYNWENEKCNLLNIYT